MKRGRIFALVLSLALLLQLFPLTQANAAFIENGYYAANLNEDAQQFYDALSTITPETLVTCTRASDGSYLYTPPQAVFRLQKKNATQAELKDYYKSIAVSLYQAYAAFSYDQPQRIWQEKNLRMQLAGKSVGNDTYVFTPTLYLRVLSQFSTDPSGAQARFDAALAGISIPGNTRAEKLRAIYDYLCITVTYSSSAKNAHSAYGAIVDRLAVCEGYAKAFKALCLRENIPCVLVSGDAISSSGKEAHMWNYVQMEDGQWYAVDATWGDKSRGPSYDYFIIGANSIADKKAFSSTHIPNSVVSVCIVDTSLVPIELQYPSLSPNAYEEPGVPYEPEEPTEPKTDIGNPSNEVVVVFTGTNLKIDNDAKIVSNVSERSTALSLIQHYDPSSIRLQSAQGNTLDSKAYLGTGTKVHVLVSGASIGYFTLIVKGDIDGDAIVTASDARIALRYSAKLEVLGNPALLAASIDGSDVTAITARKILRVSARLETF